MCDASIKSRVDLIIKYEALPISTRRELFEAFIRRSQPTCESEVLGDRFLERLAAGELNGREIKNVVRMAQALALTANKRLGRKHLDVALNVMKKANDDLIDDEDESRYASQSEGEGQDDFDEHTQRRKRRRMR